MAGAERLWLHHVPESAFSGIRPGGLAGRERWANQSEPDGQLEGRGPGELWVLPSTLYPHHAREFFCESAPLVLQFSPSRPHPLSPSLPSTPHPSPLFSSPCWLLGGILSQREAPSSCPQVSHSHPLLEDSCACPPFLLPCTPAPPKALWSMAKELSESVPRAFPPSQACLGALQSSPPSPVAWGA